MAKEGRTSQVIFLATPKEHREIKALAEKEHRSMGNFLIWLVKEYQRKQKAGKGK